MARNQIISHLVFNVVFLAKVIYSSNYYAFLDLYRPLAVNYNTLIFTNPDFLGAELGPGACVALEKINDNTNFGRLEIKTYDNLEETAWDKAQNLLGNSIMNCGNSWMTERCLDRCYNQNNNNGPSLIIGSHFDSMDSSATYAFLHGTLFIHTTLDGVNKLMSGSSKAGKGYANTIRFLYPTDKYSKMIWAFLQEFKWTKHLFLISGRHTSSIISTDFFQTYALTTDSQLKTFEFAYPYSYAMEVFGKPKFENTEMDYIKVVNSAFYNETHKISTQSRIVLLFGSQRMVRDMMLHAYDAGMTENNEYAFIIIPTNYYPLYDWKGKDDDLYFNISQKNRDEDARKAFQSAFIVTADIDTSRFTDFEEAVKERAKGKPFEYNFESYKRQVPLYAANYHDAILLWAYAMKEHYEDKSINVKSLYNKTYNASDFGGIEPITGDIALDEYGDRINNFKFWHLDKDGKNWVAVGKYDGQKYSEILPADEIAWPGGKKEPPKAEPDCGFDGKKCESNLNTILIIVGVAVVLVGALITMAYMYRKARYEADLHAMNWKIQMNDIRNLNNSKLGSSIFGTRSRLTMGSHDSSNPSTKLNGRPAQYFSKRAYYQNKFVALKIILPQYMTINRSLMVEMKALKELRNDNLLTVHGAISDNVCYLVTEYCNKGSLQDILENDEIKLDDTFKFSLINDLVKGMAYLHSTDIGSHGYLKSSNCIINNLFSLKISDFSKTIFMSDMERVSRMNAEARNERLVYRAPELLRMNTIPCQGTKEGDVYSFGIILHEILLREGPFGLSSMECDLTSTEVIHLVTKTETAQPYRPTFPFTNDSKLKRAIQMAIECWSENSNQRPTFANLRGSMKYLKPEQGSGGLVDNLLSRMEKYATNLEQLVDERTAQLQVEKKRTDDLLESMLPKSVADQLKSGQDVLPEWFDAVTIYFSDIVGFTSLSGDSTAMQVLDLLNDLYTLFDECIEKYDCYKVETIGDAYMVVSGLPIRNGDRHAAQIALMSLDFLNNVNSFVIRHKPDAKLMIRIGIHSGPVVAGIVGKKMPRYCLFGDTVNTASRMESNGQALKIHMSEQTHDIVKKHGGFIIEYRGLIEMKGKGKLPTYWLQGTDEGINLSNPRQFTDQQMHKSNTMIEDSPPPYNYHNGAINTTPIANGTTDKSNSGSNGLKHKINIPKLTGLKT